MENNKKEKIKNILRGVVSVSAIGWFCYTIGLNDGVKSAVEGVSEYMDDIIRNGLTFSKKVDGFKYIAEFKKVD